MEGGKAFSTAQTPRVCAGFVLLSWAQANGAFRIALVHGHGGRNTLNTQAPRIRECLYGAVRGAASPVTMLRAMTADPHRCAGSIHAKVDIICLHSGHDKKADQRNGLNASSARRK